MRVKVGIPRSLGYYTYYPLWRTFLEKIGAEVVLSPVTNKEILEGGVKETVNDACIPIKVFHGHVLELKDRVDYLFVPRLVGAGDRATFCPKFLGLPDMVRYSGIKLPSLIDTRFHLRRIPGGLWRFCRAVAQRLGRRNPWLLQYAYREAVKVDRRYRDLLQKEGLPPERAMRKLFQRRETVREGCTAGAPPVTEAPLTVALLGYPYALFDGYVNANLYDKLCQGGAVVVTPMQFSGRRMRRASRLLPQPFFWHYSNRVVWAGLDLIRRKAVDGIIHVTAFGCGPDAMVDKLLELEAKQAAVPYLTLTVDEHTGEAGIHTRLEAFMDMLRIRKEALAGGRLR